MDTFLHYSVAFFLLRKTQHSRLTVIANSQHLTLFNLAVVKVVLLLLRLRAALLLSSIMIPRIT